VSEHTNNRILVLDDEPGILDAYRLILQPGTGSGMPERRVVSSRSSAARAVAPATVAATAFEVQYVTSGEQALEVISAAVKAGKPFAGGFFDVKLGAGIDGIETIRRARELDASMLFVMVTAYQDRSIDEISRIFGSSFADRWDFLTKPFSSNEILQKSRNLISNWDRREKIRQYLAQIEDQQRQLVLSERLAAIGTLARGIGHEFGNILNRMMGMSELALAKDDPKEMKDTLKVIVSASERAGYIVRNLQALVKMQTERSSVDIHEPLRQALALVDHELKKASITLEEKYDLNLPHLHANRVELGQVFLNLIINATHAMENKPGKLVLSTFLEGTNVCVSISDTGTGIPEDIQAKVFEPLFTTKGDRGTGIGLSVSRKIITNHNGQIRLKSQVGQGTTFTIVLPVSK
jgi:two-component system, NtrC family, sensor kinase